MPMMRNLYDDLFFARLAYLREVMFEEYGEPDSMFERVINVEGSTRMREQTTGITGLGLAALVPEGEAVTYDVLRPEYDKTFTHSKYGLAFAVTEEAFEDDLDGPMRNGAKALGRSMRTTKNITVWSIFNNAFTTELSPDGVSVFNNAHPLIEGGTFDNRLDSDLSVLALETAINVFGDMVDQRGLPIEVEPAVLLHPHELRWLVGEILRSPDRPDTANRSINVVQNILEPVMTKYLTDDDSWFVGVRPSGWGPTLFNRRQLTTSSDTDFDTGNGKTKASQRHSQGWTSWMGWVGALGQ